jgi:hypothetical protein
MRRTDIYSCMHTHEYIHTDASEDAQGCEREGHVYTYVCMYIRFLSRQRCKFGKGSAAKMIERFTRTRGIYFLTRL